MNDLTEFEFLMYLSGLSVFVAALVSCIVIVRGKTAAILETFGKPHTQALKPGFRLKLPWPITLVVARVNLQIQEVGEDVSVKTSDNSFMVLPVKAQYRASDDTAGSVKAHYELENPQQQITSYILNTVRQTASGMEMIELYENRSHMEDNVQHTLTDRFSKFGYIIENVLVDEPQPDIVVKNAFNKVIASKREMEAAKNEAAAERIRLVGVAEAEAESKKLQGQGLADMRDAITKGLKEAVELIVGSGLTPEQALVLINETNRLDTLTTAANNGNMVILDLDKSSNKEFAKVFAATKAASTNLSD